MNYTICTEFPNDLLLKAIEPCLSIYMPTHRIVLDNKLDVLVFKNLAKEAILSLEQKYSSRDIKELALLLKRMEDDFSLWNYSKEGLAIFSTLEEMIIYRAEKAFEPIMIVSSSFHIKPLVQYYQAVEDFTLLALEAESFVIYLGNYQEIKPLILKDDTQTTLSEVLGKQHTENYQTHGGYGGAGDGSVFHGHGAKKDEVELDRIKFFRYVDRFVQDDISRRNKLPLILVSRKVHHFDFRSVSTNPFLLEDAIDGSYNDFEESALKKEIKKINDKRFNEVVSKEIERYHNLNNKDLSSDQLILCLKALLESRVEVLMVEENRIIPGKIDFDRQQIYNTDLDDPQTDDLLDDMVQFAFSCGTKVYILEKELMPTDSGVAGIFRY